MGFTCQRIGESDAGLTKDCQMYGGIVAKDSRKVVTYKWDDKKNEPYVVSVADRTGKTMRRNR